MYTEFYKLSGKPFQLSPNPRFYFASEVHQKAMAYLRYGLHQGEGFIVITGDIGTGKTTLLGYLLDQLDSARYLAAKLVTTQIEADDTLRMVASAFGIKSEGVDKATLLRQFESFLMDNQRRGRRVLVAIDEVQNLPVRSLEELRMLSNFQANDIAPVQFCLMGQPQFQQILASENLLQLRQRVIASYHLGPLTSEETRAYIVHRLKLVNWRDDPVITDAAFARIHHYAGGVPRQINTLCDRLLLGGMLEELHTIDDQAVDNVAGEMAREGRRAVPQSKVPARGLNGEGSAKPVKQTSGESAFLEHRLSALERLVKAHDRTIKRAIELAASYLNRPAEPRPGDIPTKEN
jgi:putative secretion ATPase (PEP-CTERM system associated)